MTFFFQIIVAFSYTTKCYVAKIDRVRGDLWKTFAFFLIHMISVEVRNYGVKREAFCGYSASQMVSDKYEEDAVAHSMQIGFQDVIFWYDMYKVNDIIIKNIYI